MKDIKDINFFGNLYTLIEIAINNNYDLNQIRKLTAFMDKKDAEKIKENFPELSKFIPYCNWYVLKNKNILAISAYVYDLYRETGLLPDLGNYDFEPDINKLEHWEYINPYVYEINPNEGFEFAENLFNADIWNLFLSGNARMNFYQGKNIKLEQRIKYAIVEYMLKRPQFFNTEDFVENKLLTKKYNIKESEKNGS